MIAIDGVGGCWLWTRISSVGISRQGPFCSIMCDCVEVPPVKSCLLVCLFVCLFVCVCGWGGRGFTGLCKDGAELVEDLGSPHRESSMCRLYTPAD